MLVEELTRKGTIKLLNDLATRQFNYVILLKKLAYEEGLGMYVDS